MNINGALQSYPMPEKIIVGIDDSLINLRASINQANLPTIDMDVLVTRIIDTTLHYVTASAEITALPDALIKDDIIDTRSTIGNSDNFYECIKELENVFTNIVKTSHVLLRSFKQQGLYMDQYLAFEYESMIDDKSIVLRRRRR
jgi:hypothetical protein